MEKRFILIFIVVLCGLYAKAANNDIELQTQFKCEDPNGTYKNPYDCSSYIQCSSDVPNIMPCPTGLEWNDAKKTCDYPNKANCAIGEEGDKDKITPHFEREIIDKQTRETVRMGVIDVYKQCYNYYNLNDENFYKYFFIEVDTSSYYCWRNCMTIGGCSSEPNDRFMKGTYSQDGTCIFWNINYYFHDRAIYYAQSSATLEEWKTSSRIMGNNNPRSHWSYSSKPTIFFLPLTKDQRSIYVGLGRGIKRISFPFVHFQKDSKDWGKMINIRFDESIHNLILQNSNHKDVTFDRTLGIIGKDAILQVDYHFLTAGIQLQDDMSAIISKSFRYYKGKGYEHSFINKDQIANPNYKYENEIINCEQGKDFQNPVSPDTILQSILTGVIKTGLSFIPGFGPIFSAGFGITADYFNNPEKFEKAWVSKTGEAGKGVWSTIKIILEQYKNTRSMPRIDSHSQVRDEL